jgi:hypothetical protein
MEIQNDNNTMEVIHCKVSYHDQLRRFALTGTEFTSLRSTIAQLYSINAEFVLKYKDDESDYVTLENDQDLITAIMISPKILRIRVEVPNDHAAPDMTFKEESPCMKHGRKRWNQGFYTGPYASHGGFNGGFHGHGSPHSFGPQGESNGEFRGCHRGFGHGQHWKKNPEARRQCVEKKLTWLNSTLQDMSDDSILTPQQQWRKQRLLKKKERLEYFLSGDGCKKKEKRTLTSEEEQFNCAIKLQILEIKGEMEKLKLRKKEIKSLLAHNCADEELNVQLAAVKEQERLYKTQKKDLCAKMHS